MRRRFAFVEHRQARGDIVAIEESGRQHDDGFQQIVAQEAGADEVFVVGLLVAAILFLGQFRLPAKQDALRHDDDGFAVGLERLDDVLHPGIIAVVARRHAVAEAVIGIAVGECVIAPILQRERRIHDDAIARQLVLLVEIDLAGEDAVELGGVLAFDLQHGIVERLAELERGDRLLRRAAHDGVPEGILGHNKRQRLLLHGQVAGQFVAEFAGELANGLLEDIADALEEQQREHVAAKLGMIDIAAQNVGGLLKEGVQLRLCHAAERNGNSLRFVGREDRFWK